jgi:hypothetical protein
MRLTWSEGWGNFFPGAIKSSIASNLVSTAPGLERSVYVDTYGNSAWSFNFGNPTASFGYPADVFMYASSEVAVAKVLWDILNTSTIGTSQSMSDIWSVITSTNFKSMSPYVNLDSFWSSWLAIWPTDETNLSSIFTGRQINYSVDVYDAVVSNDTVFSATTISTGWNQTHTLYPANDIDLVSLSTDTGQHYTITISDLKNGADSYVTLYNSDGLTLPPYVTTSNPNDNSNPNVTYSVGQVPSDYAFYLCDSSYGPCHENADDSLASSIEFTASTCGPYYIQITSSATRPVSASKFGTYSIRVTFP